MSATMQQVRAAGVVLGLVIALAGCATTGGAPPQGAVHAPGAASYPVCSVGHASRFPEREEVGRICRTSAALNGIF